MLENKIYFLHFFFFFGRFATEQLRESHIERIHKTSDRIKTEICEYCAKTFVTRKEVLAHIRGSHMENTIRRERVQCDVCGAWLSNRYTLKEHMVRHNSEPQKCPQCDKISPNSHALVCHIREVHTERKFSCHLCEKTFKAAIALKVRAKKIFLLLFGHFFLT